MNPDVLLAAAAPYTTPLAVVDETVMQANISGMQRLANTVGAALRPHAKTHKSARVAQLQLPLGGLVEQVEGQRQLDHARRLHGVKGVIAGLVAVAQVLQPDPVLPAYGVQVSAEA